MALYIVYQCLKIWNAIKYICISQSPVRKIEIILDISYRENVIQRICCCNKTFHKSHLDPVLKSQLKTLNSPLQAFANPPTPTISLIRLYMPRLQYTLIQGQTPPTPRALSSWVHGNIQNTRSPGRPLNLANLIPLAIYKPPPTVPTSCYLSPGILPGSLLLVGAISNNEFCLSST